MQDNACGGGWETHMGEDPQDSHIAPDEPFWLEGVDPSHGDPSDSVTPISADEPSLSNEMLFGFDVPVQHRGMRQ